MYSAAFEIAYSATLKREGGYLLHKVEGDTGGQTYAGIARAHNPSWPGWAYVDRDETPPTSLVRKFFHDGYWLPIRGDELPVSIAIDIYDFAVNSSAPLRPKLAVKLAQAVAGAEPDGTVGDRTVAALRAIEPEAFRMRYALAKLKRYADIVNANRSQAKFLLGWINRTLGALT